jgi:membrane protein DedA with SNARE-associated domain
LDSSPTPPPPPPGRANPSRRTLALLIAPIIVLVIGGYVANAIWPTLLREHPLILIALDPRNRWLVLVSNKVGTVPFMLVGFFRRVASDPLFFTLGYLYGDRAVRWVEKRFAPDTGLVPWLERNFNKFAPALVFFFPGALVCVLAGAMGMNPLLFGVLNVAGTLGILIVLLQFGDVFSGPVSSVTGFFDRNFKVFTAISILATIYYFWDQRRRGKSDVMSLAEAEHELEGDEGEAAEPSE